LKKRRCGLIVEDEKAAGIHQSGGLSRPLLLAPPPRVKPIHRSMILLAALLSLAAEQADAQSQSQRRPRPLERDTAAGVRICAGGDVTLGTNLDTGWVHTARARLGRRVESLPDPHGLLEPLRPLLADADVVLWNAEGAIGDGPVNRRKCAPGSTSCFAFRMPAATAEALRRVAADSAAVVVNLANNHARDDGDVGRRNTLRLLDRAGALTTGADTLATEVVTARGDTLAILGFAQWTGPDPRNLPAVRRHVRRAARDHRRVVVTMHMGAEGRGRQNTVDAREESFGEDRGNVVAFARAAVESGADLVIGHGPHVMRAVQWRDSALVFYSLGNLATYGPFSLAEPSNRGGLACAVLDGDGRIVAAELRSTRQLPPGIVQPDSTHRAAAIADSLGQVDFPRTAARLDPFTGEIRRPDGTPIAPPATGIPPRRRR
jgi:hypothetical protein